MTNAKLNFWLPEELRDALRAEAGRQMVGMSTMIRWAIRDYLAQHALKEETMKSYYATGGNGSIIQLSDGRWAETVIGDSYDGTRDPHDVLAELNAWTDAHNVDWQDAPLYGDMSGAEIDEYVGA